MPNVWQKMKQDFRAAMEASGQWAAAVEEREKLKVGGMPERQAWETVMRKYWLSPQPVEQPNVVIGTPDPAPRKASDDDQWMVELVDPAEIEVQDASVREIIEWVAANIIVRNVNVRSAPGTKALGLLRWVRLSPLNESDFWKSIYPKVMPTKKQLDDEQERLKDDGSDLADLCDELADLADSVQGA